MYQDSISKIIELLIIQKNQIRKKTLIILLMKLQRIIIKNSRVMFIIDELSEVILKEINMMICQEMRILFNKSNRNCKTKILQYLKKKLLERNKLEFLNLIPKDFSMKEIDMSSQPQQQRIAHNYSWSNLLQLHSY